MVSAVSGYCYDSRLTVQVVAQLHRAKGDSKYLGDWVGTRIYRIRKDKWKFYRTQ